MFDSGNDEMQCTDLRVQFPAEMLVPCVVELWSCRSIDMVLEAGAAGHSSQSLAPAACAFDSASSYWFGRFRRVQSVAPHRTDEDRAAGIRNNGGGRMKCSRSASMQARVPFLAPACTWFPFGLSHNQAYHLRLLIRLQTNVSFLLQVVAMIRSMEM